MIKRGKTRGSLYPSVEKRLIERFGKDWWKNQDLEQNSLEKCNDYIIQFNELKRRPKQCLCAKTKEEKESATEEQKREHRNAKWFNDIKTTKKGQNKGNLYPSVEQRLIKAFGPDWYTTKA
jgi:hypothetical protein